MLVVAFIGNFKFCFRDIKSLCSGFGWRLFNNIFGCLLLHEAAHKFRCLIYCIKLISLSPAFVNISKSKQGRYLIIIHFFEILIVIYSYSTTKISLCSIRSCYMQHLVTLSALKLLQEKFSCMNSQFSRIYS